MATGKHRKVARMPHPERVMGRRQAVAEKRAMASFYRKCPECRGPLESEKKLSYADAADELGAYRGDLMGFESTGQIREGIDNCET